MPPALHRIGLMTAGGDCPGLNAVVRAAGKSAISRGLEVLGICDGFLGLIEDRLIPLPWESLSNILTVGGTVLGTSNKSDPCRFAVGKDASGAPRFEDRTRACLDVISRRGLDAVLVAGGDGSMLVAAKLIDRARALGVDVNFIGLPKTIDNDLRGTELTFGFQTAVSVAADALDRVHTTAASHHRVMVVEVMGRNAGWIALHAGVASGADVILIPEIPFSFDRLTEAVGARARHGKRFTIICVAEGAHEAGAEPAVARRDPASFDPVRLGGIAKHVSDELERRAGLESRHVVLGHVQRGGCPIPADRELATLLGFHAVETLASGKRNRMVALQRGGLADVAVEEAAAGPRLVPASSPLIAAARALRTSFGD